MKNTKPTITRAKALTMYLEGSWDNVMPFDDSIEMTFIQYLQGRGFEIH